MTTTIPIVFVAGEAPVTLGLMTSLAPAKLLPAGSGRKFEVLDASTSREIDGPSQLLFFREPPDAFFVGGDPLFGRRQ